MFCRLYLNRCVIYHSIFGTSQYKALDQILITQQFLLIPKSQTNRIAPKTEKQNKKTAK